MRISWDEALDLVAAEIRRVREAHGNEAGAVILRAEGVRLAGECSPANTAPALIARVMLAGPAAGLT